MSNYRMHVMVCAGTGCEAADSKIIIENFREGLKLKGYDQEIQVVKTGCFGFCGQGPIVKIQPDNVFYVKVTPADVKEIIEEHIIKGRKVERLLFEDPKEKVKLDKHDKMDFYKKQYRIALRNCGFINPEDIEEYIAFEGYEALGKVLVEMQPEDVIETVKASGLRGRGGGGFPAGVKWGFTKSSPGDEKYVICNADEGDPGAFMDRSILEGDPHSILEAMAIAGYATGANNGIVYIRAEYPLAIKRLEIAIGQAREMGLLGENIFDSGFDFDIILKLGAGAFVCGEETALIHSMEGSPRQPSM
ncbi:MAG: NAD(P)H-dependent oxidoreductase subunit E, partial [Bacillota bacterium]|nr:NAD(P)H-dependent oxidoreductase subunit E [Bacillota bacterium]